MSIRLDSLIENLAFCFKTSAGYASKIFYNHYVVFSLSIKTVDLLGNTCANIFMQTLSLLT